LRGNDAVLARGGKAWKDPAVIAPRVLVVLDAATAWSRAVLRGFTEVACEQAWTVLHYHPNVDLDWLTEEWPADAAVLGPSAHHWPNRLQPSKCVSVNFDRCSDGIASVVPDEEQIAELALAHLLDRRLADLTTFRFDQSPFAVRRDNRFRERAARAGARLAGGWWQDDATPPRSEEHAASLIAWVRGLPKPCGLFACCDAWARVVARYALVAGIRVPEDLSLVGVDNDPLECELTAPPLSSVAVPWHGMGRAAAGLVRQSLAGKSIEGQRVVLPPTHVVTRRSSDVLAISDAIVARAVAWIHENAARRMTVPMVAQAAGVTRQRLERRFRATLGRTVMQEVRRAHVEAAKQLLATTNFDLPHVAKQSGFTTAALLSVAFQRELGVAPGAYRRRAQGMLAQD
jgi:LacI family transcriptional regulator